MNKDFCPASGPKGGVIHKPVSPSRLLSDFLCSPQFPLLSFTPYSFDKAIVCKMHLFVCPGSCSCKMCIVL